MTERLVLAGDVGGTHARLALFADPATPPTAIEVFSSADADGLTPLVDAFLKANPAEPVAATIGVAGPVRQGHTDAVNLAWPVDAAELSSSLGIGRVAVINDLEANAWGIPALGDDDLHVLAQGEPLPGGAIALASAGTGLGMAFVTFEDGRPSVHPSEGGHADFAPRSPLQEELREALVDEEEHVSYEDVCSGSGLVAIYGFLRGRAGHEDDEPAEAATITRTALSGENPEAVAALDLMVAIYGAAAGNLALTVRANGGVYLGGGIPPKILPALESSSGGFLEAFRAKGRLRPSMEKVPVSVILNELAALIGAARHAFAAVSSEQA
jgi:glucokinase